MTASNQAHPYRVCILAYSRIAGTVRDIISTLPDTGVEYIVLHSGLGEQQDACVREARRLGCEVFIAGPAGAALFASRYSYPLVSFRVRNTDYLSAIRTALDAGHKKIGITRYRTAHPLQLDLYSRLMQTQLKELVYDNVAQLYDIANTTDCDVLIGPAALQDAADAAGKPSLLVYAGREAIQEACRTAANLVRQLYDTRRSHLIAESVLNTAQLGIIITDKENRIEFFNRTMRTYTGLALHQVNGRLLPELFPNLPLDEFLKSGFMQKDSYHLINATMMRCVFRRLVVGSHAGGVLISFHPNPHNRKKDRKAQVPTVSPVYKLEKITAQSAAMNEVVRQCRSISPVQQAVTIIGPEGAGREELAHCLHNASTRAGKPCITLDCALLTDENVVDILYGYSHQEQQTEGLFFSASGGSLILKHISLACPRLLAILRTVLTGHPYFRPGMAAPILFDSLFYTVATADEYRQIPADLRRLLAIHIITLPALRERPEDIPILFSAYITQQLPERRQQQTEAMKHALNAYSWPGNIVELRSVSTRYTTLLKSAASHTARYRYSLLLKAIDEETLASDIISQYPALAERPPQDHAAFASGVQELRAVFGWSYEDVATQLGLSRTTLWRLLHQDKA